jgi:uncharacterized membrane protein
MTIQRKRTVNAIEIIALVMILLTIFIVSYNYHKLPDRIPNHFTFSGIPNDLKGKQTIWLLPVMSVIIYTMLTSITFLIGFLKRPEELTSEVMVLVSGLIRQLKLLFSILFFFLANGTIRISIGKTNGLGIAFSPFFLVLIAVIIIANVTRIIRKQREIGT